MKICKALSLGTEQLIKNNIKEPRIEAEILLAYALGLKRTSLIIRMQEEIKTEPLNIFKKYLQRRCRHEPTAYIVGYQPFMSMDFFVDRSVLIPRPETELMVETVISKLQATNPGTTIVDIGTGSGCIAISLAKHLPKAYVIGIDSSPRAIKVAQKNAAANHITDRCQFVLGKMIESLMVFRSSSKEFDIVVSNPPYIPAAEVSRLQPEVRDWEPRAALDGGKDGLKYIKILIQESPKCLEKNGFLIFEFGISQAKPIRKLAKDYFKEIKIVKDYAGIDRIFIGRI